MLVDTALGLVAAAVLAVCWLAASYALAVLLAGTEATSLRCAATAVAGLWLGLAVFWLLVPWGGFRLAAALPVWLLLAAALCRAAQARQPLLPQLRHDLARAREALVLALGGSPLVRLLTFPCTLVAALRLLRGFLRPPMNWDSLTYHLFKAGRWVQTGGYPREAAPDAWGYYEYFPPGGDIVWAWAMLPLHGELLLLPAGVLIWACCLLGTYALARSLGAAELEAGLASLAVGFTPAVINFVTSQHVDNEVLAVFLFAALFLGRCLSPEGSSWRSATLLGAALGVGVCVKFTTLPMTLLALGLLAVGGLVGPGRRSLRAAAVGLLAFALAFAVGLPSYFVAWADRGSPLYPYPLTLLGHNIWEGNQQMLDLLAGRVTPEEGRTFSLPRFLVVLLYEVPMGWDHVNLGPGTLLLAAGALAGLCATLADPRRRWLAIYLLACSGVLLAGMASDTMVAQRTLFDRVAGRFLTPVVASAAVLTAAARPALLLRLVLGLATLWNLSHCWPFGWSPLDLEALLWLAAPLAAGLALAALAQRTGLWARFPVGSAVAVLAGLLAWFTWADVLRSQYRYPLYADCSIQVFEAYPLAASGWPVWQDLDGAAPRRVAVVAGWNLVGDNCYRYLFMGRRLQNDVRYVSPCREGGLHDRNAANDEYRAQADFLLWLERLREHRIDAVATISPNTVEAQWLKDHPRLFRPAPSNGKAAAYVKIYDGWTDLYYLDPAQVDAFLADRGARPVP